MSRADGTVERHAEMTNFGLQQEDVVRIVTGNGGGYGDPKERSRDKIRDDLKNGYVTESRAKAVYGYDGSLT